MSQLDLFAGLFTRPFVFSINPEFVAKILAGAKTVEFRRGKPNLKPGDLILIYETSPTQRVVGLAVVGQLIIGSPTAVWRETKDRGGISRARYRRYFAGSDQAVAIELARVERFAEPLELPEGQRAPQSWARWRGAWPLPGIEHARLL